MARRCGASQAVRDAARKPWETAVPVGRANRRRASESLDDVPHRPRLPSYPIANHLAWAKKGRMDDPYRSLSPFLGISPEFVKGPLKTDLSTAKGEIDRRQGVGSSRTANLCSEDRRLLANLTEIFRYIQTSYDKDRTQRG